MIKEMITEVKEMQEKISQLEEKNKQLVLEKAEMLNAMKSKFSDDKFTLVKNQDLQNLEDILCNAKCEIENAQSEVEDLSYCEVSSVESYIQDAAYTIGSSLNGVEEAEQLLEDVREVIQEAVEEVNEVEEAEMRLMKEDKKPAVKIVSKKSNQ